MATATPVIESSLTTPKVRSISVEQPWQWLAAGWKDLWRAPTVSIPYGLMFVVMGYALVYTIETRFQYALALTTGFLLVGPFLSMGLYDVSRRLEAGRTPTLPLALTAWRNNLLPIALFGVLIGLLMIVWVRLSSLLFAVFMGGTNFSVDSSLTELFFRGSGFKFLLVFALIGAVVAAVVFAISVVSIPMMLDRKIDFITAVLTSLTAVRVNPGPMALWAILIAIFTGIGLITFYLGLAIALPLVGHASWHAYRSLVDDDSIEQQAF
ncbi:MAG TPA: DUF2189 domain-containing protein [Candidatus Competibacter sp.]|nr:hypothetical protein [Candidatus Competibacteraceae bacterium]HRE56132.1 DUF2189 domain-containing protein [Candidatus Competibacter sp.]HUM93648.1 DUF2189 domain-containing protein [Candidatus Competibacter sp.]